MARKDSSIALVLGVAYLVRTGAALFHFYVAPLPDSLTDADTYEKLAWRHAHDGLIPLLAKFPEMNSDLHVKIIGAFYALADYRSPLMAQAISVGFGTGSVYLVYRLATTLWSRHEAIKAAWVATLFPSLILYSALTTKEAYVWFFFLLGMLGVAHWALGHARRGALLVIGGFSTATLFHGAMFLTLIAFFGLVAFRSIKKLVVRLQAGFIRSTTVLILVVSLAAIGSYAAGAYRIPKLGTVDDLTNPYRLLGRIDRSSRDTASYPDWVVPKTPLELIVLAPARILYFSFAPFPWDIKTPRHVVGWVDGLLYMLIAMFLWRNRRGIWNDKAARTVLLVALPVFFVFAIAIGNFGTGIRHRAKIVELALVLAAPAIPRIVLNKTTVGKA